MEIIDAHVHSLPCGKMCSGRVDVTYKAVIEGLKKRGITKGIFAPINDISWQPVDKMNDYLVDIVKKNSNIVGFIDIDISKIHLAHGIKRLEEDIIKRHQSGLKGIKVHLQNLGVNGDDWRLLPIYRLAGELNIPVMIHCHPGAPPGGLDNSNPKYLEKMIRVFHKTKFIISHFGGVPYFQYMPWLNHDNVYFESSGGVLVLEKHLGIERIQKVLEEIGYDKIIFGSDFPTMDIDSQIELMKKIVPTDRQEDVFSGNVKRFGKEFGWWTK